MVKAVAELVPGDPGQLPGLLAQQHLIVTNKPRPN